MNAANMERLHRILAVIEATDRGDVNSNRSALFTAKDGRVPFESLVTGRFDDARRDLDMPVVPRRRYSGALDAASKAARRPPRPENLLDSRSESLRIKPTVSRTRKTSGNRRDGPTK